MKIRLHPLNPTVGDIFGNTKLIAAAIESAAQSGVDLLVLPELVVCGYPPRDLLWRSGFVEACERAALELAVRTPAGLSVVLGLPRRDDTGRLRNSLMLLRGGSVVCVYDKRLLPTYDVFDEDRYFSPGESACVTDVAGERVGLSVCEDFWRGEDAGFAERYQGRPDPVACLVEAGARILVNPSASPFVLGKGARHREQLRGHARRHGVWIAAVNQCGGTDDLIFDGYSCVVSPRGEIIAATNGFEDRPLDVELDEVTPPAKDRMAVAEPEGLLFEALVLGTRDYLRKTGFARAAVGLSGGIDSAVTAAIGVAAIGGANITGVSMPGRYSSAGSVSDAIDLAERLGIVYVSMPIDAGHRAMAGAIDPAFGALGAAALGTVRPDLAEENLQSRLRGTLLMALSNRTGAMVLTTGNKSELAVGYCTLYGDMNGGLAVLSDVSKTWVYRLARWMNSNPGACGFAGPSIPPASIEKPPSAELAPDQRDSDSLPDYAVLDELVERFVERQQSPPEIAAATGFELGLVQRIGRMIDRAEYKRRQAAIGLKVTHIAFGPGRRMPVAQGWQ